MISVLCCFVLFAVCCFVLLFSAARLCSEPVPVFFQIFFSLLLLVVVLVLLLLLALMLLVFLAGSLPCLALP